MAENTNATARSVEGNFESPTIEPSPTEPSACSRCAEPLRYAYFRSGDLTLCPSCREAAGSERGTPTGRFLRALAFGSGATLLSAIAWYAVIVWTDREFALLAILVGLFVGGAVRLGAYRRGGWRYQALAMFLTYAAIVTPYVPLFFAATAEIAAEETVGFDSSGAALEGGFAPTAGDSSFGAEGGAGETVAATFETNSDAAPPEELGLAQALLGVGAIAAFIFAAPFLMGLENFIGWLILAVALFEAWKLNRREEIVFEGPIYTRGQRSTYVPEPPPPPIAP